MYILADILIYSMAILFVIAVIAVVASKILSLRKNRAQWIVNGIPGKRITWLATCGTTLLLVATFFLIPAEPQTVNGVEFTDTLWIRIANMCVSSCIILLAVSSLCIVYGLMQNRRNKTIRKKRK